MLAFGGMHDAPLHAASCMSGSIFFTRLPTVVIVLFGVSRKVEHGWIVKGCFPYV